jgi:hypothetical protein
LRWIARQIVAVLWKTSLLELETRSGSQLQPETVHLNNTEPRGAVARPPLFLLFSFFCGENCFGKLCVVFWVPAVGPSFLETKETSETRFPFPREQALDRWLRGLTWQRARGRVLQCLKTHAKRSGGCCWAEFVGNERKRRETGQCTSPCTEDTCWTGGSCLGVRKNAVETGRVP